MSEAIRIEHAPIPVGQHETAAAAVATQARAMVEARFTIALARPRDVSQFRARLLKDCERPGFADVAIYQLPRGGKTIEGPSIRFLEAALRAYGNADSQVQTIYEDDEKLLIRVTVTDLETNSTYSSEHRIAKTMERKQVKQGQPVRGERVNSYGDKVYLVDATDDDLAMKINAAASRAIRTNGLRLIPGDIVEEALDAVRNTQRTKDAEDPDAARKKVEDAFRALSVMPADLADYLGHPVGQSSPAELVSLRAVYAAVRDGQATWADTIAARRKERAADRDATGLDAADMKKIEKFAADRAKHIADAGITSKVIVDSLGLADCSKADLPGILRSVVEWQPPVGDEAGAE